MRNVGIVDVPRFARWLRLRTRLKVEHSTRACASAATCRSWLVLLLRDEEPSSYSVYQVKKGGRLFHPRTPSSIYYLYHRVAI